MLVPMGNPESYGPLMITCFIRYRLDPYKAEQFEHYARKWGEVILECGADLVGYFAPHEGSSTAAYCVYHVESLAAYEEYRARLRAHSGGQANFAFAAKERFIKREDRLFLRLALTPHAKLIRPA